MTLQSRFDSDQNEVTLLLIKKRTYPKTEQKKDFKKK